MTVIPLHGVVKRGTLASVLRQVGSTPADSLDRQLPQRTPGAGPHLNQRHQITVRRQYEDFCNTHRPHRTINQAALRSLPESVTNLD